HFLGRFEKKDDAIKARRDAEDKYFKPILDKMN
ncbi:AP2 domain-containing protein, partial [Listeria monocytogenes]|nr:AP2 domain-containing protein [Listeria monocytogenes]EIT7995964.1 AP2 domain-containing protein [Listeria monocytogenes]